MGTSIQDRGNEDLNELLTLQNSVRILNKYTVTFINEPRVLDGSRELPILSSESIPNVKTLKHVGMATHDGVEIYIIDTNDGKYGVPKIDVNEEFLWETYFPPTLEIVTKSGHEVHVNDILKHDDGYHIVTASIEERSQVEQLKNIELVGTIRKDGPVWV